MASAVQFSAAFLAAFAKTLGIEGKYSNNPLDRGGETMWGITVALARFYGYVGAMKDMPVEFARYVYFKEFWEKLRCESIAALSIPIAEEVFDTAVNVGGPAEAKTLQRVLNALNRNQKDYADFAVDGVIGEKETIPALKKFLQLRGKQGESVVVKLLNCLQGAYYIGICEARHDQEEFLFGWAAGRL
jgi:lysozyme family protein